MKYAFVFICSLLTLATRAQSSLEASIGISTGMMNYQGDLKPDNFTFSKSRPFVSFFYKKPFTPHVSWRSGFSFGSLEASDADNIPELRPRNLRFRTNLQELYTGVELSLLDLSKHRVTPYVFLGGAFFHFDPFTTDREGNRVFLQPLGTEGQGLADYPDRQPYNLYQFALTYALGARVSLGESFSLGIEFTQRKTFTDYLDDVSSTYVDQNKLLQAKGPKAVELAYRGYELPGGGPYPPAGEKRGNSADKDWYYFLGITAEIKVSFLRYAFREVFNLNSKDASDLRCPSF